MHLTEIPAATQAANGGKGVGGEVQGRTCRQGGVIQCGQRGGPAQLPCMRAIEAAVGTAGAHGAGVISQLVAVLGSALQSKVVTQLPEVARQRLPEVALGAAAVAGRQWPGLTSGGALTSSEWKW